MQDGRIRISRTDVPNHIEEWAVYVVTEPFSVESMNLKQGDMVGYLRRERGNEINAATQFRHLQRLP